MDGFRRTITYAEILGGDFAARLGKIILSLENYGLWDHIVFSDMVARVLKILPQVSCVCIEARGNTGLLCDARLP